MIGLYSAAAVRAAELELAEEVPAGSLMALAAAGLATICLRELPRAYGARVLILAGPGDNGGDALYAGAILARRGAAVTAVALRPERAHPGGRAALVRAGGRVRTDPGAVPGLAARAALILDGIVGTGARGPLRAPAADLMVAVNAATAIRVAADLPSGVDPDTGAVSGECFAADHTVCFGALKTGLRIGAGRQRSGRVHVVDIGLGGHPRLGPPVARQLTDADVAALLPRAGSGDDKYSGGVLGIAAGSAGYPGAAVLCVGAAQRVRSGLVRYVGSAGEAVLAAWPETIAGVGSVADAGRVQAWTIGPGLGRDEVARQALAGALASDVPALIDADALRLVAENPDRLIGRSAPVVLTPHDREFEAFGVAADDSAGGRLGAARALADRLGVTVLLKGAGTIVAAADGSTYVNPTGTSALASAGAGDVLSGIIGSLLAAGIEPGPAAAAGAYLHGRAGELAEVAGALVAMDLIAALPAARASLVT